ncbi:putative nucleic acid-binding protein [Salinibacter ruber]|uniref:PIN domain-containing protein n=1 Tax=Salinibacter ruber TaxID=146919 RepID=UPI0021691221|nr:PIN domain-containing protein [Salinibacter ruber]MCS3750142.1 putative nucleic acid-binding protein [Salinibacter ruber]
MTICFDTNVILDGVLQRTPYQQAATGLIHAVERGDLTGQLCATTVTTVYYFDQKRYGGTAAQQDIQDLLGLFDVAAVNRRVLAQATESEFADYEDAVLHSAARTAGADGIVTRNTADFSTASLSVHTPTELLTILDHRRE